MKGKELLQQKEKAIQELCQQYGVKRFYVFGSILRPDFDANQSDLDVFVEMSELNPMERGEGLLALWEHLEQLFDRKVDLLTPDSLHNPILEARISETKKLIYERGREEIPA